MNYDLAGKTPPRVVTSSNTSVPVRDNRLAVTPTSSLSSRSPVLAPTLPITGGTYVASKKTNSTPYVKTILSDSEITEKLDGYLKISPKLWEKLPIKCHIRYFKNVPGTRADKFKSGGFVKALVKDANSNIVAIVLETQIGGNSKIKGYSSFSIAIETIEELWKKYPYDSFIEIHMMANSFAQKKEEGLILTKRISTLEGDNKELMIRLKSLEDRIKK